MDIIDQEGLEIVNAQTLKNIFPRINQNIMNVMHNHQIDMIWSNRKLTIYLTGYTFETDHVVTLQFNRN